MSRRSSFAMLIALAMCVPAATVAQGRSAAPTDHASWAGFKGGPARDGVGTGGPQGQPVLRWRYQAQGAANADIAVGDGLAFTSTDDGILHAIDVAAGVERWSLTADHAPYGGPVFADDTLYVFDGIGVLHAYDPATGTERWHGAASVGIPSNIEVTDGKLFVGTDTGLDAVDASTGAVKWAYTPPEGGGVHSPAIADGMVYASTDSAGFIAVDETTGKLAWKHDTGTDIVGTAVVADGVAFVGATDDAPGHLTALDAKTGAVLWIDDEQLHSPAVANGVAIGGGPIGVVVAHDAKTGKELWRTPIADKTRPVAIADGVAYISADTQHKVFALDAATGKELWHFDVDAGLDCCIGVADGAVFVGTGLGGVYAIGGSDDPVVVPSGGPVASAPAGARTPAPSIGAGPAFEGTWYTDPLTPAQIKAAITAAGYDPATWAPANPDAQTIVYSVALDSGQTHWYEADDGGPRQAEMGGSYVITKPGTLVVDNGNSRFELDYSLAGDVLTLHYDGPSDTLQDPGEQSAGTAFLDAGTFTKHMPATSPAPASSPVTGIPDGRWMTEPIAVGDVVKLIDGAGYDGASEVDGFGATGAATIRFTLDVDSGFMRLGDIVDAHPYTPMTGAYVLTYPKPGVFRIKDNVSTSDIAFQLDGSRLTARFLSDTDTNQDPGELGAATGIFDSAPFAPQR